MRTLNLAHIPANTTEGRVMAGVIIESLTCKKAKAEQHCEGDYHHSTYYVKAGNKRYSCTFHRFRKQATINEL